MTMYSKIRSADSNESLPLKGSNHEENAGDTGDKMPRLAERINKGAAPGDVVSADMLRDRVRRHEGSKMGGSPKLDLAGSALPTEWEEEDGESTLSMQSNYLIYGNYIILPALVSRSKKDTATKYDTPLWMQKVMRKT